MRMRAVLPLLVASLIAFPCRAWAAQASVLTPAQVVELGEQQDGSAVVLEGEAIGEVLRAVGPGEWLNVLGGGTAIGVWSEDRGAFTEVGEFGRYGQRGATVRIEGVYNAACDQHGGDRDVHLSQVTVVRAGQQLDPPLRTWKLAVAAVFAAVAGALYLRFRRLYGHL